MKKNYRVSPEIKQEILEKIKNQGLTVKQAVEQYGVSDNTVYGWLSKGAKGTPTWSELNRIKRERDQLLLLEADVYTTNKPSLKFHQSLGFKRVGYSEPKALVAGKRVPVAIYSMIRRRWRKLYAKK